MSTRHTLAIASLIALTGTAASAQNIDWINAVDGDWSDSFNWAGGNIPDATTEVPVLGLVGMYTVTSTANRTFGGVQITNPDAAFDWGANTYNCFGDVLNNGLINLNFNNSGFNSNLSFQTNALISGTGTIRFNAVASTDDSAINSGASVVTHASGHTIAGSGQITGTMMNMGDIIADEIGGLGLRLNGTMDQTGGGRVIADGGTIILGNGSVTNGGEFATMNGGVINVPSNLASISGVNITGDVTINGGGDTLGLNGDIENNGHISINENLSVFNAHIRFDANAAINGTGTIEMIAASGDLGDAQIYTNGVFLGTIGSGQTVSGSGLIDGRTGGTIINNGTIIADDPAESLGIAGMHGAGAGTYRADGEGVLSLRNGAILDGLTFDSSGNGSVTVDGNTVTGSNLTNNGHFGVSGGGRTLALVGPMTNNDTVNINNNNNIFNAHIRFDANTVIDGTGTITMTVSSGDRQDAQIYTAGGITGTIGSGQTIIGSGIIDGRTDGTIVLNGTAVGTDMSDALSIEGNVDASGGGVFRGDNGIVTLRGGLVLNGGTFESVGTGEVAKTTNGTATLSGIVNNGAMGIWGNGGFIDLAGDLTNNGTCTVNSNLNIFNAHLTAVADVSINGSGTVRLQPAGDLGDAQLFTRDIVTLTIGAGQTVAGGGQVDGRNGGTIHNDGTINGDDPTNELRMLGNHTGTGVYRSDNGILGLGNALSMDGGTFDSSGTGMVAKVNNGTATLSNMTNLGQLNIFGAGGFVDLATDFTNNGEIWINADSNIFNAHLQFNDSYMIDGTGTIRMTTAGDVRDAQIIVVSGSTGTLGSGQTLIGDGRLNGSLVIEGTIDPDGASRAFTSDDITLGDDAHMIVDLGGALAGEFDRIILNGPDVMTIDGTLTVNLEPGYSPTFGDTWDIVTGGSNTGIFDEVVTGIAPPGQVYRVIYESNRVYVILTCDADLSGDGVIDFFDVSEFLSYFSAQDVRGDLNNDGVFNFFDVSVFLSLYGQGCNP